jgi:hypothetical protein
MQGSFTAKSTRAAVQARCGWFLCEPYVSDRYRPVHLGLATGSRGNGLIAECGGPENTALETAGDAESAWQLSQFCNTGARTAFRSFAVFAKT